MYKKDLQNLLKEEHFSNFFALYGGDNFQIELFSSLIKKKYNVDENLRLYFDEYDFSRANDFLAMSSLFSKKKLLEIKVNKKINSKELKQLVNLCKKNVDNFFLLEIYDEISKQNELEKIFENSFVRFFKIANPKEAIELLNLKAKELNVTITQNALHTLFYNFDEDLYLAASELNKFENLSINEDFIQKYCFSLSVIGFDDFFEKILQGKDLRNDLEKILNSFSEIVILNSLNSSFYRLFKIALYAKINGKVDLKDLLGYTPPPQVANKLQSQAFSLSIYQYKQVFELLVNSEYELKKNSKLIKKEFLIASLLELSQIVKF